jgi:CheY-like chemotaxis protein
VLLVREAIRKEGLDVEVHVAADGKQAIDFLTRAETDADAPSPDLLLLDLNLPKIEGLEVLRRVRAGGRHKDIPALIVTSSDSPADRAEAAGLGAGYFRKTTSYEEFLRIGAVVRKMFDSKPEE